ncbi:MAG: histidine phosphotransferase family protein [Dinoroseobacter sp.]|nr:histidine phosphotransferase family protein [Dinoroseobacter sp.]MDJ0994142.1 histidine phosphotransferase family protein [Dinoroseobacter sp.]
MTEQNLTALVGSRICHDLISPLGAIGNGLELLQMAGGLETPEVALISESLENATARIRFFRIAYGEAKPEQTISGHELESALRHGFSNARLQLEFEARDMQRPTARLLFLGLQCMETAMPYGGQISVQGTEPNLVLIGKADRFAREYALWDCLTTKEKAYDLRPAQVQFALLHELARDSGRTVQVAQTNHELRLAL